MDEDDVAVRIGPSRARISSPNCACAARYNCGVIGVMGDGPGAYEGMSARSLAAMPPPIFIGGMPRSGTTLLRAILDSHPNIACGPELRAIPALATLSRETRRLMGEMLRQYYDLPPSELDDIFADLVVSFLRPLHAQSGKKRIAEKTPANALHFPELARLFPESPLIQIVRDGRDAVASVLTMDWTDAKTGKPLPITKDPAQAAAIWADHIEYGRRAKEAGARYFEIRYEDVIRTPREALAPLFEFLGEPWSDDVLEFHLRAHDAEGENEPSARQIAKPLYRKSEGRWKRDLSPEAKSAIKSVAGDLLIELGYARDHSW